MDKNIHPKKECIDLALANEQSVLLGNTRRLQATYPTRGRRDWKEHGRWLWSIHGDFLASEGCNDRGGGGGGAGGGA